MNFKPFFKSSQREFKPISNYSVICLEYPNNLAPVEGIVKLPNLKDAENFDFQASIYLRGITMFRPWFVHSANNTAPFTKKMAYGPLALELRAHRNSEALPRSISDHLSFCSSPDFDAKTEVTPISRALQSNTTFSRPSVMEGLVTTDLLITAVKFMTTTVPGPDGQDDRL